MNLQEFFKPPVSDNKISYENLDQEKFVDNVFQFILDNDELHKKFFMPAAKSLKARYDNQKDDSSKDWKEWLTMVNIGCSKFYKENAPEGDPAELFSKKVRIDLCKRLEMHYREGIQNNLFQINESVQQEISAKQFTKIVYSFLTHVKEYINIQTMPTVILKSIIENDGQPTMGRFNTQTATIEVAVKNRHPVDVLRTLAHELVHAKQLESGEILDGSTGSDHENEANMIAGILLRTFNKKNPQFLTLPSIK